MFGLWQTQEVLISVRAYSDVVSWLRSWSLVRGIYHVKTYCYRAFLCQNMYHTVLQLLQISAWYPRDSDICQENAELISLDILYLSEKTFSLLNFIKNRVRTRLRLNPISNLYPFPYPYPLPLAPWNWATMGRGWKSTPMNWDTTSTMTYVISSLCQFLRKQTRQAFARNPTCRLQLWWSLLRGLLSSFYGCILN